MIWLLMAAGPPGVMFNMTTFDVAPSGKTANVMPTPDRPRIHTHSCNIHMHAYRETCVNHAYRKTYVNVLSTCGCVKDRVK